MKSNYKSKEKLTKQKKLKQSLEKRLERWKRMEEGDTKALIEIMIDQGMATKKDFPGEFAED